MNILEMVISVNYSYHSLSLCFIFNHLIHCGAAERKEVIACQSVVTQCIYVDISDSNELVV